MAIPALGLTAYETISLALGAASVATAAYSALSKPDVKIPVVRIPDTELAQINAAIEANKSLSDQAKAAINQNIAMYNEGRLSPQYQAKLDEWWAQASRNLSQRLASAGLEKSSVAQSAYNELARQYASFSADLLRQQLSDALSLSGLSQEYINNLLSRTQLELGAKAAYAQSYAQAMGGAQQAAAQRGQAVAGLGETATRLSGTLEKLLGKGAVTPVAGSEPLITTTPETFYSFPQYEAPPE